MPGFGVTREDVKNDLQWPVDDPACWEFGTGGATRRFMLMVTATIRDGQDELDAIEDQSDTERLGTMLYGWREQMADKVVETVDQKYNDYAESHGLPVVEGRAALLEMLAEYDDEAPIAWMTAYTSWAQEQISGLTERVAKKASKKRSGGRTQRR